MLHFLGDKIEFGNFTMGRRAQVKYKPQAEVKWEKREEVWIFLRAKVFHFGTWDLEEGYTTLKGFRTYGLTGLNFLAFTSFSRAEWTIANGQLRY